MAKRKKNTEKAPELEPVVEPKEIAAANDAPDSIVDTTIELPEDTDGAIVDDASGDEVPVVIDDVVPEPVDEEPKAEEPEAEESVEEPKVEEPVEEPEAELPEAENKLGYPEVAELLTNPSTSILDKLVVISNKAIPELRTVASKLLDYEKEFGTDAVSKGGDYAISKSYDLSLILVSAANSTDASKFKVKFDIINAAFLIFAKSSMSELKLHSYDYLWKHGDKQLTTYQNLVTMITMLASKATRDDNKGKISINSVVKGTTLTDDAKSNLSNYYEL